MLYFVGEEGSAGPTGETGDRGSYGMTGDSGDSVSMHRVVAYTGLLQFINFCNNCLQYRLQNT